MLLVLAEQLGNFTPLVSTISPFLTRVEHVPICGVNSMLNIKRKKLYFFLLLKKDSFPHFFNGASD